MCIWKQLPEAHTHTHRPNLGSRKQQLFANNESAINQSPFQRGAPFRFGPADQPAKKSSSRLDYFWFDSFALDFYILVDVDANEHAVENATAVSLVQYIQ